MWGLARGTDHPAVENPHITAVGLRVSSSPPADPWTMRVSTVRAAGEKNLGICGPAQFNPVLSKGQWYSVNVSVGKLMRKKLFYPNLGPSEAPCGKVDVISHKISTMVFQLLSPHYLSYMIISHEPYKMGNLLSPFHWP